MTPTPPPPPHPRSEQTFEDPSRPGERLSFPSLSTSATLDLSVIVPAYNEQSRLPAMLNETLSYLVARSARTPFTWELLVVDDGSADATAAVAFSYVRTHGADRVRLLRMVRNSGKGAAVRQGMLSARGRYVLMADADAATVFDELERLEDAVAAPGVDVAIGSRVHLRGRPGAEGRGLLRGFISMVFNLVVMYVGGVFGLKDTQCGFKLYSREAARVAFTDQMLRRWAFDVENLYRVQKIGMRIVEVPVQWTEVPGSKLSVVKATINMITDMLRMRYMYLTGAWQVSPAVIPAK